MIFSRGIRQQFYALYCFSFAFLVSACDETLGPLALFTLILLLEIAWSVGKPHNALQANALNIDHLLMLYRLIIKTKLNK